MTTEGFNANEERLIDHIVDHFHEHSAKHDRKAVSAIGKRIALDLFTAAKTIDSGHGQCLINEVSVVLEVCAAIMAQCGEVVFDAVVKARDNVIAKLPEPIRNTANLPPVCPEHVEYPLAATIQFVGERFADMGAALVETRLEAARANVPHTVQ
jgi:hypothetical protein